MQEDELLGVSLVNMYVKCCNLQDACSVFEMLPAKNLMAWGATIAGYTQSRGRVRRPLVCMAACNRKAKRIFRNS